MNWPKIFPQSFCFPYPPCRLNKRTICCIAGRFKCYFLSKFKGKVIPTLLNASRGGSRTAATSKMERFVVIVNGYYHKALHLGSCSSSRSASGILCQVVIVNYRNFVPAIYTFLSKSSFEFENFYLPFEGLFTYLSDSHPFFYNFWRLYLSIKVLIDNDKYFVEGAKMYAFTYSYGSHQLLRERKCLFVVSHSCIKLIFTNQPIVVIYSGVNPSIYPNCHHKLYMVK